ncbi:VTT domain-containing protein [Candidatus Berkiella aquae]|uniref:DedA family protein n=1 Tax=Candidatus Berkiella aquae TaxID=295108 RepID=A0A0Q9YTU4_9GAMM|nr:YqaA family protein [Candidatus Berkiella aquae]MCS5711194.1 DedA family protein [Candidatus Berkiella aquae]
MRIFRHLYDKVLNWSHHRHAPYYLAGVSFAESSFFPIPPDVMLIPMVLSKPLKAWNFATITTISSILGGILGYLIGYYGFELLGEPLVKAFGYEESYARIVSWFAHYGFWAVLLAGFTPIPYKMFTLAAGATQMALFPFVIASILGRGIRFFVVAGIVLYVGKRLEPVIVRYIDAIGWATVLLVVLAGLAYWLFC